MSTAILDTPAMERFVTWAANMARWEDLPEPVRPEVVARHARDISDTEMLGLIDQLQHAPYVPYARGPHWVSQWDVAGALRLAGYRACRGVNEMPSALVLAKATRLINRGLLTGCPCGCRGDFELTEAGKAYLEGGTNP